MVKSVIWAFQVYHTNISGIVMIVWALAWSPKWCYISGQNITAVHHYVRKSNQHLGIILMITHHYISEHVGIVDAVLPLMCEIWRKRRPAYCKYRVCPLLQASARARMHGDEATADGIVIWSWCCCGLWLHARTHNVCAPSARWCRQAQGLGCTEMKLPLMVVL